MLKATKGCCLKRRKHTIWGCVAIVGVLLMVFALPSGLSAPLPEAAKAALLQGNWTGVLTTLGESDLQDPDAVCRMVAAQACLASNQVSKTSEVLIPESKLRNRPLTESEEALVGMALLTGCTLFIDCDTGDVRIERKQDSPNVSPA